MILLPMFITILISVITYGIYCLRYWKRKSVPYLYMKNFTASPYLLQKPYDYFKSKGHKYFGLIVTIIPIFIAIDIDLIKNILSKDFNHFNSHGTYYNEKDDPLSGHLFNLSGEKWKKLRTKLTPAFTSAKMKMMFQTIIGCSKQMLEYIETSTTKDESIDIKEVLACFTTDVIGTCAFGLECNSFKEDDIFRKYGKKILETNLIENLKRGIIIIFPKLAKLLRVSLTKKDVQEFFTNALKQTVEYRENNNIRRKDFLQLLIDMKNNNAFDEETNQQLKNVTLTFEDLIPQAFIFFFAGFETSSTTLTFALYELARNQDIQDKVRDEIKSILKKYNNEITYDAVTEMTYLQSVVDETLRKYPPLSFIFRKCTEDYKVPDTNLIIEKDTVVFIPAYQIQRDEEFYQNPQEFNPERFNEKNKPNIDTYTYLPFGEGPRICIGLRFGILQTKIGLSTLLRKYKFSLDRNMNDELIFDDLSLILSSKNDILLRVQKV